MNDVLVVDDNAALAVQVAEILRRRTKLQVTSTDDPERALQLVREEPVKVVVLDQNMPKTGTDLFRELRAINPLLKAIMLTGEASATEVGDALSLGFTSYLEKAQTDQYAPVVMRAFLQYQIDVADATHAESVPVFYESRKRFLFFGRRIDYKVLSVLLLDSDFVEEDSWRTVLQINAGEEQKHTAEVKQTSSIIIESQWQQSLKANVGLKAIPMQELAAGLEATVSDSYKESSSEVSERRTAVERTYKLPPEPSDGSLYVKARNISQAPVYRRYLASMASTCDHCGVTTVYPVSFLRFANKYATRHEDIFSDGTRRVTDTGFVTAP